MRRVALIGFLAIIASACRIDVDIGVEMMDSGSGSVSVNVVTDQEFQTLFALTGRDFEDLIASRGADVGLSFVVVPGGDPRYFAEGAVVQADTLSGILEGLAPGLGTIEIARTDTELEFDGRLNPLIDLADVAVYFEDTDPAQFTDDVSVTVNLSIPGELDSSTASGGGAGDLTWEIPFSGADTRLFARTILEPEGRAIPWALVVGVGTLVVALGFLIAIRARTQPADTTPPMLRMPTPEPTPPEAQAVGPDATPPEEQPIAPPADS